MAPFTSCSHPAEAKCLLTYTASSVLPQALESSAQQNTSLFPGKHTGDTNGGGCWSLFLSKLRAQWLELPWSWRDTTLHIVPQNNLFGVSFSFSIWISPCYLKEWRGILKLQSGIWEETCIGAKSPSLQRSRPARAGPAPLRCLGAAERRSQAEATSCQSTFIHRRHW